MLYILLYIFLKKGITDMGLGFVETSAESSIGFKEQYNSDGVRNKYCIRLKVSRLRILQVYI